MLPPVYRALEAPEVGYALGEAINQDETSSCETALRALDLTVGYGHPIPSHMTYSAL